MVDASWITLKRYAIDARGHGLADEHRSRFSGDVGIVEVAPAPQRDVHRIHIARANTANIRAGTCSSANRLSGSGKQYG